MPGASGRVRVRVRGWRHTVPPSGLAEEGARARFGAGPGTGGEGAGATVWGLAGASGCGAADGDERRDSRRAAISARSAGVMGGCAVQLAGNLWRCGDSLWSSSRGSGPGRWARACWPTTVPMSSPSRACRGGASGPSTTPCPEENGGGRRSPPGLRRARTRPPRSIGLDLKSDGGRDALRLLLKGADVLVDPFRPGVLERMECGPERLLELNPRLIIARMVRRRAHTAVAVAPPLIRGRCRRGGGRRAIRRWQRRPATT